MHAMPWQRSDDFVVMFYSYYMFRDPKIFIGQTGHNRASHIAQTRRTADQPSDGGN